MTSLSVRRTRCSPDTIPTILPAAGNRAYSRSTQSQREMDHRPALSAAEAGGVAESPSPWGGRDRFVCMFDDRLAGPRSPFAHLRTTAYLLARERSFPE